MRAAIGVGTPDVLVGDVVRPGIVIAFTASFLDHQQDQARRRSTPVNGVSVNTSFL